MPQLAKGGKYIFGCSKIRDDRSVIIPEEAAAEYGLNPGQEVILFSGSRTSGGFIVSRKSLLENSVVGRFLKDNPELVERQLISQEPFPYQARKFFYTSILDSNTLELNAAVLKAYGLKTGDYLVSGRGSYVGLAMIVKGSIVACARKHPQVKYFE